MHGQSAHRSLAVFPSLVVFALGERVFHQKFGYGKVREIDGDKLTVSFEKAGEKRVVASFVERV